MRDIRARRKNKAIAIVTFTCLICLSVIAIGGKMISDKKTKEKKNENIVDLNTAKNQSDSSDKDDVAVDSQVLKEDSTKQGTSPEREQNDDEGKSDKSSLDKSDSDKSNLNSNTSSDGSSNSNRFGEIQDSDEEYGNGISGNTAESTEGKNAGNMAEGEETPGAVDVNALVSNLSFGSDSTISWPVNGNIVLDYSMDKTIYFPTLESYRCNPAIIIQSETGTSVTAGATGVVTEVSTDDEFGNYVKVNVGEGYELTYGQLQNISVSVGDSVDASTAIGEVADPTRYYRNEGPNLYFKVEKDGEPCDPTNFLR